MDEQNLGRMRQLLGVLAALLVVSSGAPAQATSVTQSTTYEISRLKAGFVLEAREPGGPNYVEVEATLRRDLETEEVRLSGSAGLGRCGRDGCFATHRSYKVVVFELDVALTTARLVIERGGKRHRLTFRTSSPIAIVPPVYQNPNQCGGTTTTVAVHNRNAYAQGRVFGTRVATGNDADPDLDMAERMEQHLDIEECA